MILKPADVSPHNISEYYQLSDWALLIEKDILAVERIYIIDNDKPVLFAQIYIYHLDYLINYSNLFY